MAGMGSVRSAVASSACCWLPLLMVAFGFSAVGAAPQDVDRNNPPLQFALNAAVGKAGYETTGTETAKPALSGQWRTELEIDKGRKAEFIVDLETVGSRWAGEFDLLKFGVENSPVWVSAPGRRR